MNIIEKKPENIGKWFILKTDQPAEKEQVLIMDTTDSVLTNCLRNGEWVHSKAAKEFFYCWMYLPELP